jgi:hypothetical protein
VVFDYPSINAVAEYLASVLVVTEDGADPVDDVVEVVGLQHGDDEGLDLKNRGQVWVWVWVGVGVLTRIREHALYCRLPYLHT